MLKPGVDDYLDVSLRRKELSFIRTAYFVPGNPSTAIAHLLLITFYFHPRKAQIS